MAQSAGTSPKAGLAQSSPTVGTFHERDGALESSGRQESVRIEPWGPDAGETYRGGTAVTVDAPLDRIPLFLGDGARLPVAE